MKKNILVCFGTRPEYIKLKPLIDKIKESEKINVYCWFSWQHENIEGMDENLEVIGFDPRRIMVGGKNRLNDINVKIVHCLDSVFDFNYSKHKFDLVIVQGDTGTAFASALAAFHAKIPVAHVEAGLRSWDNENPYPEEGYRRMISAITTYHFCPTQDNYYECAHFIDFKDRDKFVFVTGNTGIDGLQDIVEDENYKGKVLITLHRRENKESLREWALAIDDYASNHKEFEFVWPVHPNPEIRAIIGELSYVKLIDPMPPKEMRAALKACEFIITDSGGLQEEGTFFGKLIAICRRTTERMECVRNKNAILVENPDILQYRLCELMERRGKYFDTNIFGDGTASSKIVDILEKIL